jgi:hypothetical protein
MTTRTFYATRTGLTVPRFTAAGAPLGGTVLKQFETFEVDDALIENTRDRLGESWLLYDAAEQTRRWGGVRFLPGEPPADAVIGADDEGHMYKLGVAARERAKAISNPADRAQALAEVERVYGQALRPIAEGAQHIPAGY